MRILLLGGTGAIGSNLINVLTKKGYRVVVSSRKKNKSNDMVKYIQGNAKDIEFLKEVLQERWDVIVDFMVYSTEEFLERVNVLLKSTDHYIFLSSARVYNENQKPMTEESERLLDSSIDDEFLAQNEYSLLKAQQEDILYSLCLNNWTIIRPYITYSEKRLQLGTLEKEDWLYRVLKGRTIVFSEEMKEHYTTLTYGMDVAKGIASLIINKKSIGETYHITNDNAYKWNDILEVYLEVLEDELGYRPKVLYQKLDDFFDWNPGIYQIVYDRLFDRKFDNTKINEFINTKKFYNTPTTLKVCLREFLERPEFRKINWKKEAIKDRWCKETTPLHEIKGIKQKIKYILYRYIFTNKSL